MYEILLIVCVYLVVVIDLLVQVPLPKHGDRSRPPLLITPSYNQYQIIFHESMNSFYFDKQSPLFRPEIPHAVWVKFIPIFSKNLSLKSRALRSYSSAEREADLPLERCIDRANTPRNAL